jgi:hypothetical protein
MKSLKMLFCFLLALPTLVQAATSTGAAVTFSDQVALMDKISPYVERIDLARLIVVKKSAEAVSADIVKNLAEGRNEVTFQTLRLVQNLIVQYRFSQVFFGWTTPRSINSIYTEYTAADLAKLQTISTEMVKTYGYDDSPYTQITANTFRQMQRLLQQLETLPMDASFKQQLRDLWQPIGETIAIAEQGDRPKTFAKAIPVIQLVQALYPMFDKISASEAGFPMIMELQGLTEFYAEFAQMDQP